MPWPRLRRTTPTSKQGQKRPAEPVRRHQLKKAARARVPKQVLSALSDALRRSRSSLAFLPHRLGSHPAHSAFISRSAPTMTTSSRLDLHQTITDRIIAVLEVCSGPWHHSWSGGLGSGRTINRLRSAVRPAPYGSTIHNAPRRTRLATDTLAARPYSKFRRTRRYERRVRGRSSPAGEFDQRRIVDPHTPGSPLHSRG